MLQITKEYELYCQNPIEKNFKFLSYLNNFYSNSLTFNMSTILQEINQINEKYKNLMETVFIKNDELLHKTSKTM